jgi:hypothetical protein
LVSGGLFSRLVLSTTDTLKEVNLAGYNLESVSTDTLSVRVGTGTNATLKSNLAALLEVLSAVVCKRSPNDHWNPIGLTDKSSRIALTAVIATINSNVEVGYSTTTRSGTKLRILTDVADSVEDVHFVFYLTFYYVLS